MINPHTQRKRQCAANAECLAAEESWIAPAMHAGLLFHEGLVGWMTVSAAIGSTTDKEREDVKTMGEGGGGGGGRGGDPPLD